MAKMTCLEMVQSIMSDMDSDNVTTVLETAESEQVLSTLKDVYFQLITNRIIPEHYALGTLTDATAGSETFMEIPSDTARVISIRYNVIASGDTVPLWREVNWIDQDEFLRRSLQRDSTDTTNVDTVVDPVTGVTLYVGKLAAPRCYTVFDDHYICFDSYDSAVDATGLIGSKTVCWTKKIPTWTDDTDGFIPDMDENYFPLLLAEAKSTCFVNLKQQANPKIEKQARQQRVYLQDDKYRTTAAQSRASSLLPSPDFGRRRP